MAAEEKPKVLENGRDMVLSLGIVVVMMLVAVGATGLCSINPEESSFARKNPVDAATFLHLESQATSTVLREPQLPPGWVANSARRTSFGGEMAAVVGWVTAGEGFVQSAQTALPLDKALSQFDGQYRPNTRTVAVEGMEVTVRSGDSKEIRAIWGFDLGDARVILTGSAADADFATAVRAFQTAPRLAK